jgi:anthranilate/para-aminobenzoate synthase component II
MDDLFFNHDKAYAGARCEQNKQLRHAKTKEERKAANATFKRLRQQADDILYRELARLPSNPGEWVRPAPDSKRAIQARSQAEMLFRIRRNF